jgi:hypothetical protein
MNDNENFNTISLKITKELSKDVKKKFGIFISPKKIIQNLVEETFKYFQNPPSFILEPSCGSCEIIDFIDKKYNSIHIDGIELNDYIFQNIQNIQYKNSVQLFNQDFLKFNPNSMYDLIIGNPPYVVCNKEDVPTQYIEYCVGRPNLFCLFILHSIFLLKENGILSFIIPRSFLNSHYYSNIRNFLKKQGTILQIIDYSNSNLFLETQQTTIGFIYKKTNKNIEDNYSLLLGNQYIFNENSIQLKELLRGSTTLKELGLFVKTGTIVWNQCKDILTNDDKKTLLIYNSNISDTNELKLITFSNAEKKQFIDKDGSTNIILVVNRGNGNSSYNLKYSLVNLGDRPYLVENHLNIIYSKKNNAETIPLFELIVKSLKNKKTDLFIKSFLGNNGLSKTELETIFPIFL